LKVGGGARCRRHRQKGVLMIDEGGRKRLHSANYAI
jgi:hypothetical protein